jgi:hypothetical protein
MAETHLRVGSRMSRCGLTRGVRLSEDMTEVTCRLCLKMRRSPAFGDDSFPGLGKLKCTICGKPYRDHPLTRFCPWA